MKQNIIHISILINHYKLDDILINNNNLNFLIKIINKILILKQKKNGIIIKLIRTLIKF